MNPTTSVTSIIIILFCSCVILISGNCVAKEENDGASGWTESFNLQNCDFVTMGRNEYFILEPGYQLTLEGKEGEDNIRLVITVLEETEMIDSIETRVVEERESENGEVIEVSRNYFAMCARTNSVFYFGEDVDIVENGKLRSHSGSWRADAQNANAGVMMPGIILLGARYYQEIAPGVAMDRAEIVSNTETLRTPAGVFKNCLKVKETTPLEPKAIVYKVYAPGVGLIQDGSLLLSSIDFIHR